MDNKEPWEEKFDRGFGFDTEYLKTLPAKLDTEDVGKLIADIRVFVRSVTQEAKNDIAENTLHYMAAPENSSKENKSWCAGYNTAINDLKTRLGTSTETMSNPIPE